MVVPPQSRTQPPIIADKAVFCCKNAKVFYATIRLIDSVPTGLIEHTVKGDFATRKAGQACC